MNSRMRYDLLVIGSGAAGHHGAIQGAKLGKRVAVVERWPWLGGATINTGTIPSKTVREAAIRAANHGASIGDRIEHVASIESAVYANQFRRNEVDVLSGEASFVSPNLIRIKNAGESFNVQADRVLIATGTRPAHNPDIPVDGASILDTDVIRRLPPRKRAITIVGGGVIGVEYACIAAQLEASVTLIERRPQILEFIDHEIVEALSYQMRVKGVTFRLGEEVESVTKNPDGKVCATLKSGKQVWSDGLLYAVGRQGNTESPNCPGRGERGPRELERIAFEMKSQPRQHGFQLAPGNSAHSHFEIGLVDRDNPGYIHDAWLRQPGITLLQDNVSRCGSTVHGSDQAHYRGGDPASIKNVALYDDAGVPLGRRGSP